MKFLAPLILAIVVITSGYFWWTWSTAAVGAGEPVDITIAPNQSATQTITDLADHKLIKSPLAAKIYLKLSGIAHKLRPGTYQISPTESLVSIFADLTTGPADVQVTFPEGWRREQMAVRLKAIFTGMSIPDFLTATATLEGQLFPDTYLFPPTPTIPQIISIMTANFKKKTGLSLPADNEVLVLASMF